MREPLALVASLSWDAAHRVVARRYRLDAQVLGASERLGKRQRTPRDYWDVRKIAISVAVRAADCTYAAMAREIGMHRDTVTSQCLDIQARAEAEPMFARLLDQTEHEVRVRLDAELTRALAELVYARARIGAVLGAKQASNRRLRPTKIGGVVPSNMKLSP
jgi:hypothetical protein